MMTVCNRCGEEMRTCERYCYGSHCEDCYSTVWIYLGKQSRRYCAALDPRETVYSRRVRRNKVKRAKY